MSTASVQAYHIQCTYGAVSAQDAGCQLKHLVQDLQTIV